MMGKKMMTLTVLFWLIPGWPLAAQTSGDQGLPAEASSTFRDPLTRDPMLAKSLSLMSTGMGHYYNGNFRKMRKYQSRMTLARIPFVTGLCLDVGRNPLKGVDQFKDLSFKNFPWYAFGGMVLSGAFTQRVREADADEAYNDALRLKMNFEETPLK